MVKLPPNGKKTTIGCFNLKIDIIYSAFIGKG